MTSLIKKLRLSWLVSRRNHQAVDPEHTRQGIFFFGGRALPAPGCRPTLPLDSCRPAIMTGAEQINEPGDSPLRLPTATELVAEELTRKIVRNELRPGEYLPIEGDLVEQFGVSRPTVREALRVLEAESLISLHKGARGGARVRGPQLEAVARYGGHLIQAAGASLEDVLVAEEMLQVGRSGCSPLRGRRLASWPYTTASTRSLMSSTTSLLSATVLSIFTKHLSPPQETEASNCLRAS